ncbi:G patch domain-containing protein 4 [Bombyx mandarina]|uniref:G patch domain-containing protein 4 n=1 Tax=Bombyx mandarina TaxID=7092 RepID=A0A6J2KHR5_BOMMA|nr:G patch domain-containing protein 4 [Bombyx mandarina]
MDFARKQLEKYGWTDGKGLGKHENGISEALKPKLKRSVTGIGHDPAAEFNEHWWSVLYNKAADNVQVQDKNGKTKKIKIKDDFNISTNTWQIDKKPKNGKGKQYSENFIRTEVLTKGGGKTENVKECDSHEENNGGLVKMTDEELFAACEGRTAHKGARHGLSALGKLARIAQQEEMLLMLPKYNGYSHAKNKGDEQIIEDLSLQSEEAEKRKKKKKKRKRCTSNEGMTVENSVVTASEVIESREIENVTTSVENIEDVESVEKFSSKKKKNKKQKFDENSNHATEIIEKTKKGTKRKNNECINMESMVVDNERNEFTVKSKKKKKIQSI